MLGKKGLDALQEGDRDRAAHAAAVERQNPLRTGSEQMAIAGVCGLEEIFDACRIGHIAHTDNPKIIAGLRRLHSVPSRKMARMGGHGQVRRH